MTATKSMDMELMHYGFKFLGEEPQSNSSVLGDQMDCGTFDNFSDVSPKISKDSDLFLFNPINLNTTTNREAISSMDPLSDPFTCQDSDFSLENKLEFSTPYSDDFYNLLDCGSLMQSPLSTEDIESVLETNSLSDDGDVSLLPFGSPPSSPESQDLPVSSPLSLNSNITTNDGDGIQVSDLILDATLGQPAAAAAAAATTGDTSRSVSPCLMVSSPPGKEKRTKFNRTKKTPYSRDKSTESISLPIDNLAPQLSKKEKKKLQNKNAATRYRQKMKEEAEQQKEEEDGLLDENVRLKKKVEDIQKEIQYLKNLLAEIQKVRTNSVKLEQS